MTRRAICALAALALLAGCDNRGPPGQVALSVHDAYARLADNPLTAFMEERQCGLLIHVRSEGRPDQSVTWRITNAGREMLNFTAVLTPVDARHTRFEVVLPKDATGFEAYSGGTLVYRRPAIQYPARPAIEEQVAALLQGRPYDPSKLPVEDTACNIQRGALESGGKPFRWDDLKMPNAYVDERFKQKQAVK